MPDRPAPDAALVEIADFFVREVAKDPRNRKLRAQLCGIDDVGLSRDDLDPEKRSIPSELRISLRVGGSRPQVRAENPRAKCQWLGERLLRQIEKSRKNLARALAGPRADRMLKCVSGGGSGYWQRQSTRSWTGG